jgi:hypothetical protein
MNKRKLCQIEMYKNVYKILQKTEIYNNNNKGNLENTSTKNV